MTFLPCYVSKSGFPSSSNSLTLPNSQHAGWLHVFCHPERSESTVLVFAEKSLPAAGRQKHQGTSGKKHTSPPESDFTSYEQFRTELAKKKVKLSLTEEAEWEAHFLQEAKQALALKSGIAKTDKEIDRMVYELYGLTEEEIRIVEGE
jgi:hypothetical protein